MELIDQEIAQLLIRTLSFSRVVRVITKFLKLICLSAALLVCECLL